VNGSVGSVALLSVLTNPFKFSSKVFLARILESDKAENLVSLLVKLDVSICWIFGFSSIETVGFEISLFGISFGLASIAIGVWAFSFEISAIE